MKGWIYTRSRAVFWGSLALYIFIWATVSYVGVYVTYFLGPIILVSGLVSYFFSPKDQENV